MSVWVRVWEREDVSGVVLTQVPWAGGALADGCGVTETIWSDVALVCSWTMKSGKTGNKATASSVCHRLISTIECELNHGPADLCVWLCRRLQLQAGGAPAEPCGQLE